MYHYVWTKIIRRSIFFTNEVDPGNLKNSMEDSGNECIPFSENWDTTRGNYATKLRPLVHPLLLEFVQSQQVLPIIRSIKGNVSNQQK